MPRLSLPSVLQTPVFQNEVLLKVLHINDPGIFDEKTRWEQGASYVFFQGRSIKKMTSILRKNHFKPEGGQTFLSKEFFLSR